MGGALGAGGRLGHQGRTVSRGSGSDSETDADDDGEALFPKANPNFSARPQRAPLGNGAFKEVYPDHWGITIGQCLELVEKYRAEDDYKPTDSMYDIVKKYVRPWTKHSGMGYAVMVNKDRPRKVNIMVSHCWAENADRFFRRLERSVSKDDVMFICALSLYQFMDSDGEVPGPTISEQLGKDPAESPFRQVLESITKSGESKWAWRSFDELKRVPALIFELALLIIVLPVVYLGCVPVGQHCAKGTAWPVFGNWLPIYSWSWKYEPLEATHQHTQILAWSLMILAGVIKFILSWFPPYRGHMLVVPNLNVDIYTRLWCVYEIFTAVNLGVPVKLANTLAHAGKSSAAKAQTTMKADMERIRKEIESYGRSPTEGYNLVDGAVRKVMRAAMRTAFYAGLLWGLPLALCTMQCVCLLKRGLQEWVKQNHPEHSWWAIHHSVHRIGYDIVCHHHFLSGKHGMWGWALVAGIGAGYCVVIYIMVRLTVRKQGLTKTKHWFLTVLLLIMIDLGVSLIASLIRLFGLCETEENEESMNVFWHVNTSHLSWFVAGLGFAIMQGVGVVTVTIVCVKCCPALWHAIRPWQLTAAFVSVFSVYSLFQSSRLDIDHIYPTLFTELCMLIGIYMGPTIVSWGQLVRWGVTLDKDKDRYEAEKDPRRSPVGDPPNTWLSDEDSDSDSSENSSDYEAGCGGSVAHYRELCS